MTRAIAPRTMLLIAVCLVAIASSATAGTGLSQYRGLTLGDSVATAAGVLNVPATNVKVLRAQPSLVEQLTWRPILFVSGATVQADAIAEMVLTFHVGRLVRIAVTYERDRTAGLTETDLRDAITAVYGAPSLLSTSAWTSGPERFERKEVGRWEDAGSLLSLWHERYPERLGLTLTSVAADAVLQAAIAEGARLDSADAPARDLARRTAEAAAQQARLDKIRLDNKAAFKP
jgi:hypothetical protein